MSYARPRELSLRVSVAALVRVIFEHPLTGERMLALERKATALEQAGQPHITVRAQPFGGAIRFRELGPLQALIGAFQFDSERSRAESDFRILIRPAAWDEVRQFCLHHFLDADDPVLDSDPARELAEELADSLGISLRRDQYEQQPTGVIVADRPQPTHSRRAPGFPTARIYRVFEARVLDGALASAMLANSESYTDQDVHERALAAIRNGSAGRANAVLVLPLKRLTEAYLALPPAARAAPVTFDNYQLDGNVPVVLEGVTVPDYQIL